MQLNRCAPGTHASVGRPTGMSTKCTLVSKIQHSRLTANPAILLITSPQWTCSFPAASICSCWQLGFHAYRQLPAASTSFTCVRTGSFQAVAGSRALTCVPAIRQLLGISLDRKLAGIFKQMASRRLPSSFYTCNPQAAFRQAVSRQLLYMQPPGSF
jgi:hypothetical protein